MPTIPYVNAAGNRVPGTTTVIGSGLGWSKDALKHWAWKLGTQGKHYRDETNWAATTGTIAHAMIEAHIRGLPFVPPEGATSSMLEKAQAAYEEALQWMRLSRLEIVATECNMVSERYQFGATPDALAVFENELHLLDWKATNGTYAEHIIQLAAYGAAIEEVMGLKVERFHLCRFSKDYGMFSYKSYKRDSMAKPWRAFLRLRDLYGLKPEIEGMAR